LAWFHKDFWLPLKEIFCRKYVKRVIKTTLAEGPGSIRRLEYEIDSETMRKLGKPALGRSFSSRTGSLGRCQSRSNLTGHVPIDKQNACGVRCHTGDCYYLSQEILTKENTKAYSVNEHIENSRTDNLGS